MRVAKYVYFVVCLMLGGISISNGQNLSFEQIGVPQGLSHHSIYSIAQDTIGQMWFATYDGINIYDGKRVSKLQLPKDSDTQVDFTLRNNTEVISDGRYMWYASPYYVSRFDVVSGESINRKMNSVSMVIAEDRVCVAEGNKIFVGAKDSSFFSDSLRVITLPSSIVLLDEISPKEIFAHTDEGLYIVNLIDDSSRKITSVITLSAAKDPKGNYWVGSVNSGLYVYDSNFAEVLHLSVSNDFVNGPIRAIAFDVKGDVWIGTIEGLYVWDISQGINQGVNTARVLETSVYDIYEDNNSLMWISGYMDGVFICNHEANLFKRYNSGDFIQNRDIKKFEAMVEDDDSNLWTVCANKGIGRWNREAHTFTIVKPFSEFIDDNYKTQSVYFDNEYQQLLIGTLREGLVVYDVKNNQTREYNYKSGDLNNYKGNRISSIFQYLDSYLLCTNEGIYQYYPQTKRVEEFEMKGGSLSLVQTLFIDSRGVLWIGTRGYGIYTMNLENREVTKFKMGLDAINDNISVISIEEDSKGRMFISTRDLGVFRYDIESGDFKHYTEDSGDLLSDFTFKLKKTPTGDIWVVTANGLTLIDIHTDNVSLFSYDDYIKDVTLGVASCYESDDEVALFGEEEFFVFTLSELPFIKSSKVPAKLVFSDIVVNNKRVLPGDGSGILQNTLPFVERVELDRSCLTYSFSLSYCDYRNRSTGQLLYRIKGLDSEWIPIDRGEDIYITQLKPGNYTLQAKLINMVNGTQTDFVELEIASTLPFYLSATALIIYIVLISVFATVLISYFIIMRAKIKTEKLKRNRIAEINRSKLHFFTSISHEFRTPLTIINAMVESLVSSGAFFGEAHRYIDSIQRNSNLLLKLVVELLDFRKIEQGFTELSFSEVNLNEFVGDIVESFGEYSKVKGVELYFKPLNRDMPLVWIDGVQMQKVFYNLINNAFKALNTDGGVVSVAISEDEKHLSVSVTDNGVGISKGEVSRIFDCYYQIENRKRAIGSGIGLSLSKGIVDLHRGNLTVDSKPGEGSTFTVEILKGDSHVDKERIIDAAKIVISNDVDDDSNEVVVSNNSAIQRETEGDSERPLVLVVEDNIEMRQLICDILREEYRVIDAEDGVKGLEVARAKMPNLIISDVMMPNMSGFKFCTELRSMLETCHIPVMLLTAKASIESHIEGVNTGADAYMTKPFDKRLLLSRVKNLLRNRELIAKRFMSKSEVVIDELPVCDLDKKFLSAVEAIIVENLSNEQFRVDDIASSVGLGRTSFYQKVKSLTGETPNELLLSIKLQRAAHLLKSRADMNISDIAYELGFNSREYFTKVFKKRYNLTPKAYRDSECKI